MQTYTVKSSNLRTHRISLIGTGRLIHGRACPARRSILPAAPGRRSRWEYRQMTPSGLEAPRAFRETFNELMSYVEECIIAGHSASLVAHLHRQFRSFVARLDSLRVPVQAAAANLNMADHGIGPALDAIMTECNTYTAWEASHGFKKAFDLLKQRTKGSIERIDVVIEVAKSRRPRQLAIPRNRQKNKSK